MPEHIDYVLRVFPVGSRFYGFAQDSGFTVERHVHEHNEHFVIAWMDFDAVQRDEFLANGGTAETLWEQHIATTRYPYSYMLDPNKIRPMEEWTGYTPEQRENIWRSCYAVRD